MTASTNARSSIAMGDFVEVGYVAKLADSGRVIDTTDPTIAEEAGIADLTADGPVVVVLGAGHLFDPVEEAIVDADVGETGRITVDPEDAFGEPDPASKVTADLDHFPPDRRSAGTRVQYKGQTGFLESVSEEAATVNFNHPLAGSAIEYEFTVHRRVEETLERARGLLGLYDLAGHAELQLSDDPDDRILTLELEDPMGIDDYQSSKRDAIADLDDHLDIDEIRIVERYRGD